jgi:hypothetical protein
MKKIFLAILTIFSFISFKSNAQLEKGNVIVGADLANFNIGLKKGAVTSIDLTPKAAWMLDNNIALGGYIDFGFTTQKAFGTTYSNTNYGVGVLGRYYVNNPKYNLLKAGRWFAEANVGFQGTNTKGGNSTNGLGLGFGPGYAYFITKNVALETLLKFEENIGFGNSTSSPDLNLHVGFQIYLPGKSTVKNIKSNESM